MTVGRHRTSELVLLVLLAVALIAFLWSTDRRIDRTHANCVAENQSRQAIVSVLTDLVDAKDVGPERSRLIAIVSRASKPGGDLSPRKC